MEVGYWFELVSSTVPVLSITVLLITLLALLLYAVIRRAVRDGIRDARQLAREVAESDDEPIPPEDDPTWP